MRKLILGLAATALLGTSAAAQDRRGVDHPLAPRYEGSFIIDYRGASLDEIVVPTGPIVDEDAPTNQLKLEGRVTHIDYRLEPATAPLQIERYYTGLLQSSGFETVYTCVGPACGRDMGSLLLNSGKVAPVGLADGLFNDRIRVVVARRGGDWVVLHVAEGPGRSQIYQAVIEGGV